MIKDLMNLANRLDSKGLTKEADVLDLLIKKIAKQDDINLEDLDVDYERPTAASGYEQLSDMPGTVQWVDGPVDEAWLHKTFSYYKKNFPSYMWPQLAGDFEVMLSGERFDPDVVSNYRNRDGTGIVSRQTVEALVAALHGGLAL